MKTSKDFETRSEFLQYLADKYEVDIMVLAGLDILNDQDDEKIIADAKEQAPIETYLLELENE